MYIRPAPETSDCSCRAVLARGRRTGPARVSRSPAEIIARAARIGSLLTVLLFLLAVVGGSAFTMAGEGPLVLSFGKDGAVCRSFMGFGAEWDPGFWGDPDFKAGEAEADWNRVLSRISWMKLPLTRMMMQVRWCRNPDGKSDFESAQMKRVYRHLDVCQELGITVILTDWGCEPAWLRVEGITNVADAKYAEAIGAYMDHLVKIKGYRCIKYFVMGNEPNCEVRDWDRWKQGILNVSAEFRRRGLVRQVAIAGPDETGGATWHRRAVEQLQAKLGAYDLHYYVRPDVLRSGRLQEFFRTGWAYAVEKDAAAGSKPLIVGEAGVFHPGFSAGNNPHNQEYSYGVEMADYAVQAASAGSWAVLAWMLEDSSHQGFSWGMWKDKSGNFALKPWFYTWAMLTRYAPAGSTTYRADSADLDVRALAVRSEARGAAGWTICLVNRGDRPRLVKLRAFEGGQTVFRHYLYSKDHAPADKDGLPVPVEKKAGNLTVGVAVACPADSVGILTSIER